jgi:hypothetical protein
MDWDLYKKPDGSLDIIQALQDRNERKPLQDFNKGFSIVQSITSLTPIKSTELATTIFILAIGASVGEE